MIGSYGDYTFDDNAIVIGERRRVIFNSGGQMMSEHLEIDVAGYLKASGQSAITTAINALKTALAKPYKNFILKQDDSSNSAHVLLNATSISGVTVLSGPDFVESRGAEYSTERKFTFTVQADYPLSNTDNLLMEFSETMSFSGGGSRYIVLDSVAGPAQKQKVRQATGYYVTQQGTIVGYRKVPVLPPPRWPNDLLESPNISQVSPEKFGKGYQGYRVNYSYRFGSVNPFKGVPTLWT